MHAKLSFSDDVFSPPPFSDLAVSAGFVSFVPVAARDEFANEGDPPGVRDGAGITPPAPAPGTPAPGTEIPGAPPPGAPRPGKLPPGNPAPGAPMDGPAARC